MHVIYLWHIAFTYICVLDPSHVKSSKTRKLQMFLVITNLKYFLAMNEVQPDTVSAVQFWLWLNAFNFHSTRSVLNGIPVWL